MKHLKSLVATLALSLALSTAVFAGEIQMPTARMPVEPPAPTVGETEGPETTDSEELSLGETLLLQLLLTIF